MLRLRFTSILISVFLFLGSYTGTHALQTVYVNQNYTNTTQEGKKLGTDVFTSLQEGIDAASEGGVVYVSPGIYKESIHIEKSLSLIGGGVTSITGASPYAAKVDGGDATGTILIDGPDHPVTVTVKNLNITGGTYSIAVLHNARVTIDKNTITNYKKNGITFGPVFLPKNGDITGRITNNVITGIGETDTLAQNGIQISEDNTAVITGNRISNNMYSLPGTKWATGVLVHLSKGVSISNNTFIGNQVGVNIIRSNSNSVTGNTLRGGDKTEAGVLVSNSTTETIYTTTGNIINRNTITGGKVGIWSSFAHGNKYLNNTIRSTTKHGIYLWNSSNSTITSNKMSDIHNNEFSAYAIEIDDINTNDSNESAASRNNSLINNTVSKSDHGFQIAKNSKATTVSANKFNGAIVTLEAMMTH